MKQKMTGLNICNPVRQKGEEGGSEVYTQLIIYLLYWRYNIISGILKLLQKPTATGRQLDIYLDTSNYIPSCPFRIVKFPLNKINLSIQNDTV